MTSDVTETTVCGVTVPYVVHYIKRGKRKTTISYHAERVDIRIRTVGEAEAPVAFVVTSNDGLTVPPSFDVREFDDACWWPIGDKQGSSRFQNF
jgi:hypothetical protein